MSDYRSMYYRLAGKVADAIELLIEVQQECENRAMEEEPPTVEVHTRNHAEEDEMGAIKNG